jgi:hypothetical protein
MVHDGQSKPTPGNVCAQLLLGACVLLVPPLLMVAGVMYEGSSPKDAVHHALDGGTALAPR